MDFDELFDEFDNYSVHTELGVANKEILDNKQHYQCCSNQQPIYKNEVCLCKSCNMILEFQLIDELNELKVFNNDDKQSATVRYTLPSDKHDNTLGSLIDTSRIKNKGTYNLLKYSRWMSISYKEANKFKIFDEIRNQTSKCSISLQYVDAVISKLNIIIDDKKKYRNNNLKFLTCALFNDEMKHDNHPRSGEDIATIFNVSKPQLTKGIKILNKLKEEHPSFNNYPVKDCKQHDYIKMYSYKVKECSEFHNKCVTKLNEVVEKKLLMNSSHVNGCCIVVYKIYLEEFESKNKEIKQNNPKEYKKILNNCKEWLQQTLKISLITLNKLNTILLQHNI